METLLKSGFLKESIYSKWCRHSFSNDIEKQNLIFVPDVHLDLRYEENSQLTYKQRRYKLPVQAQRLQWRWKTVCVLTSGLHTHCPARRKSKSMRDKTVFTRHYSRSNDYGNMCEKEAVVIVLRKRWTVKTAAATLAPLLLVELFVKRRIRETSISEKKQKCEEIGNKSAKGAFSVCMKTEIRNG